MGPRRKTVVTRDSAGEQEMRDQEVLRANKELAAYFSGQRTEREARAALKIIKAFVRDRERRDAKGRPPLPTSKATKTPKAVASRKAARDLGQSPASDDRTDKQLTRRGAPPKAPGPGADTQ
jgi:hypothetical protein